MTTAVKDKAEVILLPEGRLINHSLFERDAYKANEKSAPGKPMYKVEMAYDPDQVTGEGTIEDRLADAIDAKWGVKAAEAWLNGERGYISNLLSGDDLAAKRADKGKEGDAYKGKIVIRANTSFNRDGIEAPGGAKVYAPDTSIIGIVEGNQGEVYNGCYGHVAVTISTYEDSRGDKGVKCYLTAFQKTKDGPRLKSEDNTAALFKPVAGTGSADTGGVRRRRAG